MVNEEIYVLTKHAKFQSEYIENIPVYRRRYFLYLFEKEMEELIKSASKTYKQTHNKKIEVKEEKTVVEQTQNYKDTIEKLKYIVKNIIDVL